jgi:hypothetical protein
MSRVVGAVLIVFLSGAIAAPYSHGAQTENWKPCTTDEANHAFHESNRLKDWDAVYRYFKELGHCDSGAIAELSDDSIIRLLLKDWSHFDVYSHLAANDKRFERFVLRHIDELASREELEGIARNAKSLCPQGQSSVCQEIESAVADLLSDTHPLLGVLEDIPGRFGHEASVRAVRVLFQEGGGDWQPFRSECRDPACLKATTAQYPEEVTWTIAFDGKNLGQVNTRRPSEYKFSADVGLEEITSIGSVPTVGKRSKNYSGFAETDVYRPLVAISEPNFADPERWKPVTLSSEMVAALRQQFRNKFANVSNCANPDENVLKPWQYAEHDIAIGKAYGSQKGWFVAEMKLTEYRCDGPLDGSGPFVAQWYVVDPAGTIRFLDSGMWLVDAGDYDGDGKSELVFAIDRYDIGGYELFYDEFRKHAVFRFFYH